MKKRQKTEEITEEERVRAGRVKTIQLVIWTLAILLQMGILKSLEGKAATTAAETASAVTSAEEIIIRLEIEESPEACKRPDSTYEDENGILYELASWSAVPAVMPSVTRNIEKVIRYDQVEGVTSLPEEIEITANDRERRQTAAAVCRIIQQEAVREEWQDGFAFTVTFHTYEAGYYELAGRLIPYNDETPELAGCETELLELAGVSPEDYRVTHVQWSGGVYTDESGNRCRDAAAFGQKRLRDYRVTYSGTAVFPEKAGWQTVAVYHLPQPEAQEETPEETSGSETVREEPQTEIGKIANPAPEPPVTLWERITRTLMMTIALGAAIFFAGLLLLAILRLVKRVRSCYNRRK